MPQLLQHDKDVLLAIICKVDVNTNSRASADSLATRVRISRRVSGDEMWQVPNDDRVWL